MKSKTFLSQRSSVSSKVEDKSAKPGVSGNFGESLNNRTLAINETQINQDSYQSSAQVRQQNEEYVHY